MKMHNPTISIILKPRLLSYYILVGYIPTNGIPGILADHQKIFFLKMSFLQFVSKRRIDQIFLYKHLQTSQVLITIGRALQVFLKVIFQHSPLYTETKDT